MLPNIKSLRFSIRTFLGNYPWFFFTVYGLKKHNKELFINDKTQLVVSAYPRTANTFFHVALTDVQKTPLSIAHHLHVPALTLEGVKKGLPTVVLIRNPKDSIISLVIREKHITLSQAIKAYLDFYKPLLKLNKEQVLVVDFKRIINDFHSIISDINTTFNLNLDNYSESNPIDNSVVFGKIEKMNREFNKNKLNESVISRPSDDRKELKQHYLNLLEDKKYSGRINKCLKLYNDLTGN